MRLWTDGIVASSVKVWRLGLMLPQKSGLGIRLLVVVVRSLVVV